MAQIRTTVRTEIIDVRGERLVVEREGVCTRPDNPTYWAKEANQEAGALLETVVSHIAHEYGDIRPPVAAPPGTMSEVRRGQVVIVGHPANKRLVVKGGDGKFRLVDTGEVVDDEDFRGGWRLATDEELA